MALGYLGHAVAARQATRGQEIRIARRDRSAGAELAARLLAGRFAEVDGACPAGRAIGAGPSKWSRSAAR